jgi:hypothetical protein
MRSIPPFAAFRIPGSVAHDREVEAILRLPRLVYPYLALNTVNMAIQ